MEEKIIKDKLIRKLEQSKYPHSSNLYYSEKHVKKMIDLIIEDVKKYDCQKGILICPDSIKTIIKKRSGLYD